MAEFLSDQWLDELEAVAASAEVPADVELTLQQVVLVGEEERAYALRLEGGRLRVVRGRVDSPDITFTQDRGTAAAIARGEQSAQAAFLAGDLRIGGDLHLFADRAAVVADLGDVFAALRSSTTW